MTALITDLCLITGQFCSQFWDHLWDQLHLMSDLISDPISGQLCNHLHDCPHDCLCNCLVDGLHSITGKLCDQLCDQLCDHLHGQLSVPNSDIAEAQDPGLGLQEAMAKERRIVCSLIIQCHTTCMYILMVSLMVGP